MVFQWEVYYMVDRLLTGLATLQKGTTAWWYSNKTSLVYIPFCQALVSLIIDWFSLLRNLFFEMYAIEPFKQLIIDWKRNKEENYDLLFAVCIYKVATK